MTTLEVWAILFALPCLWVFRETFALLAIIVISSIGWFICSVAVGLFWCVGWLSGVARWRSE